MNSVRIELAELFEQYTEDPVFWHMRNVGSKFVPGEGNPDHPALLLLGEAPGRNEDREGRPFVGQAGHILNELLGAAGLGRSEQWVTNVVKYRPVTPGGRNRTPDEEEIGFSRPYLREEVRLVNPRVIVPMGNVATACVDHGAVAGRLVRGQLTEAGSWLYFPTYHPAYVIYQGGMKSRAGRQMVDWFCQIVDVLYEQT